MKIDVMINNGTTFYHTLDYPHCELFKIDMDDVISYVKRKLPTIKYRNDVVLTMDSDNGTTIKLK